MLIYSYRQSDMCYMGAVEVPDGTTAIPPFHDFTPPPEKSGFHAVMTHKGWVLVKGPTPPDPQPEIDLMNWRSGASCTPLQGRLALSRAGLMDSVEKLINGADTPQDVKIAWEYSIEWRRMSSMITSLSAALKMTDEQVDELFREAQSINI